MKVLAVAAALCTSTFAAEHHHLHVQPKPRHGEALPLVPLPLLPHNGATNVTAPPPESCLGDAFRYGLWRRSPSNDASSAFKKSLKAITNEPEQGRLGLNAFSPFCGLC